MILSQHLSATASKNATKAAFRYLGKELTFDQFKTQVSKLSYLYGHEIGHQQRVAFVTHNSPAVAATFFAMTNTRSVVIPLNPDQAPDDLVEALRFTEATHVAVTSDVLARIRDVLSQAKLNLPIIDIEKKHGGEYDSSFTPAPDNTPIDGDQVLIFKSGGGSGKAKYVIFNHKQILAAATSLRTLYHLTVNDRILTNMNWNHPFSFLHGMLFPLMNGATTVVDLGLENKEFLEFLIDNRVTRLVGSPPFFYKLLIVCRNEKRVLPGTKSITVGVGMLSPELRKAFRLLKVDVGQCYGKTEAGWTISMEDVGEFEEVPPKYVGKGLPGMKYKVLDPNGDEILDKGARQGLLAVSGPCVMSGYLKAEKETKNAIRGTWLYTGDYAELDGDAETLRIRYLGRKEELYMMGDQLLSPDVIDTPLRSMTGIQDGAGFILKTMKNQTVFACAVIKTPGSTVNEKSIIDHCAMRVPMEMRPTMVVFTDSIPRDAGGSVMRSKLTAQFAGTAG
ncbi:acyl--CoA ligase [bacterium]|jgi:acyl-CoA synthetase (AMP-forming)/AMP-acid ligase II|nr:acyl--CoA ligase [bacterium]